MIPKWSSRYVVQLTLGVILGFLLAMSCVLVVAEGGEQSIFTIIATTTNTKGAFSNAPVQLNLSFPEILRALGVEGKVDPRSIRVQQDGFDVPFRLSDSILSTGEGTVSWRKNINGEEDFAILFALEEEGVDYDYPKHIPLIGNGDYFTYGLRGTVGDFVGWLAHRVDIVDWYGTGENLILVSGHEGTHQAAASLFRLEGFTSGGSPIIRQVLPIPIQESIVVADFRENGLFDLLAFSTSHSNIIWHKNIGAPELRSFCNRNCSQRVGLSIVLAVEMLSVVSRLLTGQEMVVRISLLGQAKRREPTVPFTCWRTSDHRSNPNLRHQGSFKPKVN